jgi:hypothetical protein
MVEQRSFIHLDSHRAESHRMLAWTAIERANPIYHSPIHFFFPSVRRCPAKSSARASHSPFFPSHDTNGQLRLPLTKVSRRRVPSCHRLWDACMHARQNASTCTKVTRSLVWFSLPFLIEDNFLKTAIQKFTIIEHACE